MTMGFKKLALAATTPTAPPEEGETGEEGFYASKKKKSWLPAAAVGGLGALAAYKFMRRPSFSSNPAMRKIQERAQQGFHRVVDVSPHVDDGLDHGTLGRLWEKTLPQVNAKGELTPWNKAKLWLHEGSQAIPVAQHPITGKTYVPGAPEGAAVKGWVYNRSTGPLAGVRNNPIHGGLDLEGDLRTQRAVSDLALGGKGREADVLTKHAPGAVPTSVTDLRPFVANRGRVTPQNAKALQRQLDKHMATQGIDNYALKPTHGLSSGGEFPHSADDWGAALQAYNTHMANPENLRAFRAANREGANAAVDYLRANEVHEGHVVATALKNPSKVFAQQWAEHPLHEYRVHAHRGVVIPGLTSSRMGSPASPRLHMSGGGPGKAMEFAQHTIDQLPAHLREGMYGMDVMPIRNPDGTISFKVVEMNPAERGSATSAGGSSGFLSSDAIPGAGWRHFRAITGRHTEPAALLGAAGTGLGAAALARHFTPEQDSEDPHPVG